MAQSIYQQRLAARDVPRLRWETQVAEGATISDLDVAEILRTARLGVEAGRVPEDTIQAPAEEILRKFHLTQDGSLLNAAVALFGQPDPVRYPQTRLHLAHFNGTTKDADMLDLVPPLEGHAFAHRDYAHAGGSVHVAIFTDRVEVTNAGSLPAGMPLDDLLTEHESKPRNPLIAKVFFRRKLIDEWGRGTRSIVALCRNAGHPDPEFFMACPMVCPGEWHGFAVLDGDFFRQMAHDRVRRHHAHV